ncbi:hypothetical protein SGGMMB4_02693 [Sodalis glossinidius str. 'morsitans']|uniref:Uncharacterized protein n=1 Tax=Sodalis glossinidius (strain morsitans) TaxID=343509 RepID=A0A193QIZ5_SODGM|nr:hypothetical protein SGGMMB4_02693 [Sodalis glossinidius str. 'morsitans']
MATGEHRTGENLQVGILSVSGAESIGLRRLRKFLSSFAVCLSL